MFNILKYEKQHESELLTLLKQEPAWNLFTSELTIDTFREALLTSESYICKSQGVICGYLRALVDGFGVYISELYVAPAYRKNGYGKALLNTIKQTHIDQVVYVFSDEDGYYEKLSFQRVGSVFQVKPTPNPSQEGN